VVCVIAALSPIVPVVYPTLELPELDLNVLDMSVDGHPATLARDIAVSLDTEVSAGEGSSGPSPRRFLGAWPGVKTPNEGPWPAGGNASLLATPRGTPARVPTERKLGVQRQQSAEEGWIDVILFRQDLGDILEPSALAKARRLDLEFRSHPTMLKLCQKEYESEPGVLDGSLCRLPDTAINFFFPTVVDGGDAGDLLITNGRGEERAVQATAKALLLSGQEGYFDRFASADGEVRSVILGSRYFLGGPLAGFSSLSDRKAEQLALYDTLADAVQELSKRTQGEDIRFIFVGDGAMVLRQIMDELEASVVYAGAAVTFILAYVWVQTGSLWLAFAAASQILLTFPITYLLYTRVMGYDRIGIMNLMSLWAIAGIGVDDVFLLTEMLRHSRTEGVAEAAARDDDGDDTGSVVDAGSATVDWATGNGRLSRLRGATCSDGCAASCAGCFCQCCTDGLCPASRLHPEPRAHAVRLARARHRAISHALQEGAAAMLVTSFTTAASFYSNAISRIPAVRGFGLWTGTLVVANYVLVLTVYAAALSCHEANCRLCLPRCVACVGCSSGALLCDDEATPCLERLLCCASCRSGRVGDADGANAALVAGFDREGYGDEGLDEEDDEAWGGGGGGGVPAPGGAASVPAGGPGWPRSAPRKVSIAQRVELARRERKGGGSAPLFAADVAEPFVAPSMAYGAVGDDGAGRPPRRAEKARPVSGGWRSVMLGGLHRCVFFLRWPIVAALLALLATAGYYASTIQPAQDPPLLLVADTNLETLRRVLATYVIDCHSCLLSASSPGSSRGFVVPAQDDPDGGANGTSCSVFGCNADSTDLPRNAGGEVPPGRLVATPSPSTASTATPTASASASAVPTASSTASPSPSTPAEQSSPSSTPAAPGPPGPIEAAPRPVALSSSTVRNDWYPPAEAGSGVLDYELQSRAVDDYTAAAALAAAGEEVTPVNLGRAKAWARVNSPAPWPGLTHTADLGQPVPGGTFRFRVAALSLGGRGPFSPESDSLVMPGQVGPPGLSPSQSPSPPPGGGTGSDPNGPHINPSPSPTPSFSAGVTPSSTQTPSGTPSVTPSPTASGTPTPTWSPGASQSPSATPTASVTASPSVDATPSQTPQPTTTASATPSASTTATATALPTPSASASALVCAESWFGERCDTFCGGTGRGPALPADPGAANLCARRGTCVVGGGIRGCECDAGFGGLACAYGCPNCGPNSVCDVNATNDVGTPAPPSCKCVAGHTPVEIVGPDGTVDKARPYGDFALICAPRQGAQPVAARRRLARVARAASPAAPGSAAAGPAAHPLRGILAGPACPESAPPGAASPADLLVCSGEARGRCVALLDSSSGSLLVNISCQCYDGFRGSACEQVCPSAEQASDPECSGAGTCLAAPEGPPDPAWRVPVLDAVNATCDCTALHEGDDCSGRAADPFPLGASSYSMVALIFGVKASRPNPDFDPSEAGGTALIGSPGTAEVGLKPDQERATSPVLDPAFDLASPDAQLYMVELCSWMESQPGLVLFKAPMDCWMRRFASWLRSPSSPAEVTFPVTNRSAFGPLLVRWAQTSGARTFFGVSGPEQTVVWARLLARSTVDWQSAGSIIASRGFPQWQGVVEHVKRTAPASMGSNPVQASDVWLRAFVELEFVSGTALACAISVGAAFLTTLAFVQSFALAGFTAVAVGTVLVTLLAFVVLSGSFLGVIEAIAVVCLVGLSIDSALHFAHGYIHAPRWLVESASSADPGAGLPAWAAAIARMGPRGARASFATQKMGWPILSSAITTAGASAFLLFTTVEILRVFGIILVFTICCSLLITLVFLNAMLSACGPAGTMFDLCSSERRAKTGCCGSAADSKLERETLNPARSSRAA